jgi:hypothetical protein
MPARRSGRDPGSSAAFGEALVVGAIAGTGVMRELVENESERVKAGYDILRHGWFYLLLDAAGTTAGIAGREGSRGA